MDTSIISNDAIAFWAAFFLNPKSTLSFGGDDAEMRITQRARNALIELLEYEIVAAVDPTDQIPNREFYASSHAMHAAVMAELSARAGDDSFTWMEQNSKYTTFEGIEGAEKPGAATTMKWDNDS